MERRATKPALTKHRIAGKFFEPITIGMSILWCDARTQATGRVERGCYGKVFGQCAGVTGLARDPTAAGCILVAAGHSHLGFGSGFLARDCGGKPTFLVGDPGKKRSSAREQHPPVWGVATYGETIVFLSGGLKKWTTGGATPIAVHEPVPMCGVDITRTDDPRVFIISHAAGGDALVAD